MARKFLIPGLRVTSSFLLTSGLAVILMGPPTSRAQPAGNPVSQIELLAELSKALGAAAQSVGQLGAEFGYLAKLATCGYDAVEARQVSADLLKISAKVGSLTSDQQATFPDLESFAAHPSEKDWESFLANLEKFIPSYTDLLEEIKSQRNDFVTTQSYEDLQKALDGKLRLTRELRSLGPPKGSAERQKLKEIVRNYEKFVHNLSDARKDLNAYVHAHPNNASCETAHHS
jgi:hypothetical protein